MGTMEAMVRTISNHVLPFRTPQLALQVHDADVESTGDVVLSVSTLGTSCVDCDHVEQRCGGGDGWYGMDMSCVEYQSVEVSRLWIPDQDLV